MVNPLKAPLLATTDLVVDYKTVPQPQLDDRSFTNFAGRLLSGSSAANYGAWMRAPAEDYDLWAKHVGDTRWSYQGLLPHFRRTEMHHDPKGDRAQHGFEGAIHTTSGRQYPLRDAIHQAFNQAGFSDVPDLNSGAPLGVAPWVENWNQGLRQHSGKVFELFGIHLITTTAVSRIILDKNKIATGVELQDGRHLTAKQEVIISCGAHKTPQLLMLSGIGPSDELQKHNIPQLISSPTVGQNHFDHLSLHQAWKLRHPEQGLALGHPSFNNPSYALGFPVEWIAAASVPPSIRAPTLDSSSTDTPNLLSPSRAQIGLLVAYAPLNLGAGYPDEVNNGSHISTAALLYQPTSRGRITLASANPADEPVVDPQYYSTAADKACLRWGVRRVAEIMETAAAREVLEGETAPRGLPTVNSGASDEDVDKRIRANAEVWHHSAGTAAMGKAIETSVVDSHLRVHGAGRLRVVDASVLPRPLSATPQATVYAIAEMAAEMIADSVGGGLKTTG